MIEPRDPAVRELAHLLRGRLIWPGDDEYDALRLVDNIANDRRPAVIVRAADASDIAAVVRLAADTGAELAIRAGGHSLAGHSTGDGRIVLDLRGLDGLAIDPRARTAVCGAGVRAGDYTRAAAAVGLATPFGDTGSVGVAGITLGGGIGWLVRRDGLTIDSLRSVDLVTAEGLALTASATSHPDLFWAVRGGGGNFGVVTSFTFGLHEIDQVLHGSLLIPFSRPAIRALIEIGIAAPEALTLMPSVMAIPPIPGVPETHVGGLGIFIDLLWSGVPTAGPDAIAPLRRLGPVLMDTVEPKAYQDVYPEPTTRSAYTARSLYLDRVDDTAIATIERHLAMAPPGQCLAHFRILGGAAARVAPDTTAYGWRDRTVLVWLIADAESADPDRVPGLAAWAEAFEADLGGLDAPTYVNFMADEGPGATARAYPPATLARLRAIKQRYDPANLFRGNQNITPA